MELELAILAVIGLIFGLILSWQNCIKTVLWILIIEGAFRKWILPGAADLIYFAKDGLLVIAYIKYLLAPPMRLKAVPVPKLLQIMLLLISLVVLVSAFNPNLGSPLVGIVGIRSYLLYIPLMFLVRDLFETKEELTGFLKFYLTASLPLFALALVQYWSPRTAPINKYVGYATIKQGLVGQNVRVTSTFSYIAGYAWYLQTIAALVLPFIVLRDSRKMQLIYRIVFACAIAGIALTGSRGPILNFGILLFGYLILNKQIRQLGLHKKFIGLAVLCSIAGTLWFGTAIDNYTQRFTKNKDLLSRVQLYITAPLDYIEYAGVTGYGVGATYQAANRLRQILSLPEGTVIPVYYESEPERIMLELGVLGFVLWYLLRLFLVVLLWQVYTRLKIPVLRELALIAMLVHLTALPHQMVYQITFMVYYWFFAGFIFLLPQIETSFFEHERFEGEG